MLKLAARKKVRRLALQAPPVAEGGLKRPPSHTVKWLMCVGLTRDGGAGERMKAGSDAKVRNVNARINAERGEIIAGCTPFVRLQPYFFYSRRAGVRWSAPWDDGVRHDQ